MSGRVLKGVDIGRGTKGKGLGVTRRQGDVEFVGRTIRGESAAGSARGSGEEPFGGRWGTWP